MNCLSTILSLVFVYLTINAGTTYSSVISNPSVLQEFYRTALDSLDKANAGLEENLETGQDLNVLSLVHLLEALSNVNHELQSRNDDDDNIRSTAGVQKRSTKNDAKRTQDMSRLAMRILKRNGQQTSRVAYRILKKRRNNAARIAMRVLKRDPNSNVHFENFNRVTRASPYSNIGGYFGGMSLGQHVPYGFSGMTYYPKTFEEPSEPAQKRADCLSNCEDESTAVEDEEA